MQKATSGISDHRTNAALSRLTPPKSQTSGSWGGQVGAQHCGNPAPRESGRPGAALQHWRPESGPAHPGFGGGRARAAEAVAPGGAGPQVTAQTWRRAQAHASRARRARPPHPTSPPPAVPPRHPKDVLPLKGFRACSAFAGRAKALESGRPVGAVTGSKKAGSAHWGHRSA